jgi:hypothetical protein
MKKACDIVLIVVGLLLLFFLVPHDISTIDSVDRYRALVLFLKEGLFSPTPYSMIGPLFAAPLNWISGNALPFDWWCARYNTLLLGLGLLGLGWALKPLLDGGTRRAFLLLLVAASMFPHQVRNFHGDMFTALAAGTALALMARRGSALGWPLGVLGVANTPGAAVGYAFAVVRRMWRDKRWRYALALLAVAALILGENALRHGHPLRTGYEGNRGVRTALPYSGLPGFSYPLGFGALALLFSFGKGLVFFAPGILLCPALRRWNPAPALLDAVRGMLWFTAGLVLVYGRWWAWYGGFTWGPRFLLFASIPASLALALTLSRADTPRLRAAALAALLLSVWVGVNGAVFGTDKMAACLANNYANESFMWYVPEFSVLWRPFVKHRPLKGSDMALLAYGAVVFVWLAAPLARKLAADATETVRRAGGLRAAVRGWRF